MEQWVVLVLMKILPQLKLSQAETCWGNIVKDFIVKSSCLTKAMTQASKDRILTVYPEDVAKFFSVLNWFTFFININVANHPQWFPHL